MGKQQPVGTPTTYAPPAPPTAANAAAVQAAADARQKALDKKGISSTLLNSGQQAGMSGTDAGNLFRAANPGQKNTLLGGG